MTARELIRKLNERKGTTVSVALHLLVLGWALVTFSTRSVEAPQEDVIPVDITMDDTSKMMQGIKTGKKENPKPLAEKVAEAKPADDPTGKIDKKDVVTSTSAPDPTPKPVEKPVEKKPDPKPEPKKEEPKKAEKKPDEKADDPIADALKADAKKPPPKQETKAAPAAQAEGAHLRSVEDRGPAGQARPVACGGDRRNAQLQRRARHADRPLQRVGCDLERRIRQRRAALFQLPL